jgi:glycosyltransferase involved in cell wall biosynthesis
MDYILANSIIKEQKMPDGIKAVNITAVMHLPKEIPYPLTKFYGIVKSILQQYDHSLELIILDQLLDKDVENEVSRMNTEGNSIIFIREQFSSLGAWLNASRARAQGDYLLYIDNTNSVINLKRAASATFILTAERNPQAGMLYADYEILQKNKIEEVHLLKHHPGRVRDNQDYGLVSLFKNSELSNCGGFDESLQFNTLYDIHLKLAESSKLVHISNRYSGSVYQAEAKDKGHNVFDYLLASKESQIEAENVLSDHLKRIKGYLAPGRYYEDRPEPAKELSLEATVIIPVNNRPDFISTAIESVLDQTIQDIEIIVVVNGGADDPTNKTVKNYMPGGKNYNPDKPEVRLIPIDINNIGLCLNLGSKMARGKYYVQLDSDDRLKSNAIEKILDVFDEDPKIGIVIGSYEVWEKNDKNKKLTRIESIPVVTHDEWTEENGRNNLLRINGAGAPRAIPISVIKKIGYFGVNDEPFARNYGEDYEMVLKISEIHRVGRVWDPIYEVVRHKGGTDHSIDIETIIRNDEAKDYMRLEAIKRRQVLNQKKSF